MQHILEQEEKGRDLIQHQEQEEKELTNDPAYIEFIESLPYLPF